MDFKYEFERLLFLVDQFVIQPQSRAALQTLKNASGYYNSIPKDVYNKIDAPPCPVCGETTTDNLKYHCSNKDCVMFNK